MKGKRAEGWERTVTKNGEKSLRVSIPPPLAKLLDILEGDIVLVDMEGGGVLEKQIVIRKKRQQPPPPAF